MWLAAGLKRKELAKGDTDRVMRGMELLSWRNRDIDLRPIVTSWEKKSSKNTWIVAAVVGATVMGLGVLGVVATGESPGVLIEVLMVVGVICGLLFWSTDDQRSSQLRKLRELAGANTPVVFTSTGIVVGDVARLYNSRRGQLVEVGWCALPAKHLLLRFSRRGRLETIRIPVPEELMSDVEEIAAMLTERIQSTAMPLPDEIEEVTRKAREG